ncbi:Kinase, partial [Fasciolopsis buskii]
IRLFLGPDSRRAQRLARLFSARLQQLTSWFEKQRLFAFYASSLLLAYANPSGSSLKSTDSWTESSSSPPPGVITSVANEVNFDCTDQSKNNITGHFTDESIVVSLIDFTRWCELSSDRDDNVLYGLYKLIDLFERAATNPTSPALPIFSDRAFVRG